MIFQTFNPTQTQLRMIESSGLNNLSAVFRIDNSVDQQRLSKAIETVIKKTAPFSYRFLKINESSQILETSDSSESLHILNAVSSSNAEGDSSVFSLIQSILSRSFRLDRGSPYSFSLIKSVENSYLVFTCHPALMDRFSLRILFQFISKEYNGKRIPTSLGLSQALLLEEEKNLLSSHKRENSVRFWLQLSKETSFEWRPARVENDVTETSFNAQISSEETHFLKTFADERGMELPDLLRFCFHIFLYRMTKNETVVTAHHHRISTGPSFLIGFNENKPIFKSLLNPLSTVQHYFKQAKKLWTQTQYHSDLPAQEMTRELKRLDPGFSRPTNILFTEDTLPFHSLNLEGVSSNLIPTFSYHLESEDIGIFFDITDHINFFIVTKSPQQTASIRLAFEHYLVLINNIRTFIDQPIREIQLFNSDLKSKTLEFSDGGPLQIPATDIITGMIQTCVQYPNEIAVSDIHARLTYSALKTSAEQIAQQLLPHYKGNPESLVGLCLPRTIKMIEGIYGVLFSGAAYLPLDSKMPGERLSFISSDANLSLVIADHETKDIITPLVQCPVLIIEDLLQTQLDSPKTSFPVKVPPTQAAYVIYTSGTTGKPKGVILERQALSNFVAALDGICRRGPGNRWMQFASYNFDASVLEIFNPLTNGGELIIAPLEVRTDPEALFNFMQEKKISHTLIPPALMPLLPRKPLPDLKTLFTGGEVVDEETSRFWSKVVDFRNCYGPTEATVMCTQNQLGGYKSALQLGRPLPGYKTYILDELGNLAPIGGVGEICIGGNSVARGYLGRADLTALKFIPDIYSHHHDNNQNQKPKLYRTGDLARFLPNGDLEFLGRNDFQVKLRGFRIELGDIENAITEQPEVRGAYVAITDQQSNKSLTAWYVSQHLAPEQMRKRLSERLPHYMVPSYLVRIDSFPLNVNGKIDRTRLPTPQFNSEVLHQKFDEMENAIRQIWSDVLKIETEKIGIESHFFHLGGHSLVAAMACIQINKKFEINIRPKLIFEHPVFIDFCEIVRAFPKEQPTFKTLVSTKSESAIVRNRLIELIYSRAAMNPDDNMYNIVMRMNFTKEINPIRLQKILTDFLNDNPIFHTSFNEKENHIWGEILTKIPVHIPLKEGSLADINLRLEEMRSQSLGIHKAPLWDAEIIVNQEESCLLFNVHHILFDGWSLNLMIEELSERYQAASEGRPFKKERITWFDYCDWADGLENSKPYLEALIYWRKKLENINARVELPVKSYHKVPNSNCYQNIRFNSNTVKALKKFADKNELTLPPVFMALYLVWAWRLSNQNEIVCGYPYAGRDIPGSENIFGTFVTMGYLRQSIQANDSFLSFAKSVHQQMLEDKEHLIAAPYDAEISGMDSLNLIFSLQSGIGLEGKMGNSNFRAEELPSLTSKGDVTGVFYQVKESVDQESSIEGRIEFDSSIFDETTMFNLALQFEQIVEAAAKNPNSQLRELNYQTELEISNFIKLSTGNELEIKEEMSIIDQFFEIVHAFPNSTAVQFENSTLTYQELDQWSDQIATRLPRGESYIGISEQKGLALIAGILGILKRGAAYVPLDPNYPMERLQYIMSDTGLSSILVDELSAKLIQPALLENISLIRTMSKTEVDQEIRPHHQHKISPDSLAYIIHTSGSTGSPKGVMIEHRNVTRFIKSVSSALDFDSNSVGSLIASSNFDASVFEIFSSILNGGKLIIIPDTTRKNPNLLHQCLIQEKVTHSLIMPALLQNMPLEPIPSMVSLIYGGDSLDENSALAWSRISKLYTLYGPTEITVAATVGRILPNGNHKIVGHPLPGYRVYLLNHDLQPVPQGTVGEICIGGEMVARGYLNRDDLTMQKFVLDPFGISPYSMMYLSGDLGRYLPNGEIEFLGRNDQQIKLRGFRIELEEIEVQLSKFKQNEHSIQKVVCALKGEGDNKYLAAYYISKVAFNENTLRDFLSRTLPEYMIPSFYIKLEIIPVSPNGKVDRKQLPAISSKKCENPPHEGLESDICKIWEEVLCLKGPLNRDESFFHLGGNSLLVVRMQSEVRTRLDVEFSIGDFYSNPTIMSIAEKSVTSHIEHAIKDSHAKIVTADSLENLKLENLKITSVLLTGGNGFLGSFLLHELQKNNIFTYCFLRAASVESGLKIIEEQTQKAGLKIDFTKIKIIPGDLSLLNLGLSTDDFKEITTKVDAIIHCGAYVHHLHSYSTLKAPNVKGTKELLKIALTNKKKPFTFISTQSVGASLENSSSIQEAITPNHPVVDSGYILTKWVGEQICAQASRDHHIPVHIARPGNITGAMDTGFTNFSNNHFWLFNKGCIQLKAFPELNIEIEMTPVDKLAKAIVAMSLSPKDGLNVSNLSNPNILSIQDFYSEIRKNGFDVKPTDSKHWQEKLEQLSEANALSTIKEFYQGDLTSVKPTLVERNQSQQTLKNLGIEFNVDLKNLIPIYLRYLKKSGFLK